MLARAAFKYLDMLRFPILSLLYATLVLSGASASFAAENGDAAPRAQPWAFGVSSDREDAIWRKGENVDQINSRSRPKPRENSAANKEVIDRALRKAADSEKKSAFGLSVENSSTRWRVDPDGARHAGEDMVRDKKHVLRAFAGVKAGDDLSVSVGPELIIKDESHGESSASAGEPDSAFGLGMKFKYDF